MGFKAQFLQGNYIKSSLDFARKLTIFFDFPSFVFFFNNNALIIRMPQKTSSWSEIKLGLKIKNDV